jgi:phenylalanyl-tRNA synthetase beta chain
VWDAFGLPSDDPRRQAAVLANPLSDAEPELRTSLLPGLLAALLRNLGRGSRDLALYELGQVFTGTDGLPAVPRPGVEHRPSPEELKALYASVPAQPRHAAVVLAGEVERRGWWGPGRAATWADAVEAARTIASVVRARLEIRRGDLAPWHPGRCAELVLDGTVVGHAGELHPRVVAALDLPPRTCAMELDLDAFPPPAPAQAPTLSSYPPVLLDVALVVSADVPSAAVGDALREGGGGLLESVRLFDVYRGLGGDRVSLAFSLRFRAPDRTLTVEEATALRDAAVALATERTGAVLRT